MIVQPVNIEKRDIFKFYSQKYKIFQDYYSKGLFGLEIRGLGSGIAAQIRQDLNQSDLSIFIQQEDNSDSTNVFLTSTALGLKQLLESHSNRLYAEIASALNNYLDYSEYQITIGDREFWHNQSYVMGILNVTPDSFSDGGKYYEKYDAVQYGLEMLSQGADIIDIGGESTRPGAEDVDTSTEIKRVVPVIKGILTEAPDTVISIDTTKSEVARAALDAGALIVNDISGLTFDEKIVTAVKDFSATLIVMHIKGTPRTMQIDPQYGDVISEIYDFLHKQTASALEAGLSNIIIDPGIGFGKRVMDNYEILRRLDEFKGIGLPIMIGLSKKSFLGKSLNIETDKRTNATVVAETAAISRGACFIRTHDVPKAFEARQINNFISNPVSTANV